jgi:hypothetical protein
MAACPLCHVQSDEDCEHYFGEDENVHVERIWAAMKVDNAEQDQHKSDASLRPMLLNKFILAYQHQNIWGGLFSPSPAMLELPRGS